MRGLWLENQALTYRQDISIPSPASGEALVKVLLAGVCSTDLELLRGYYPFTGIPGHEFVGEVVSSPNDSSWVGKRVVGEINITCGKCETCQAGRPRHCEHRKTLGIHAWDGVFAEYLVLPLVNLRPVPASIPDTKAVFTEPLAAACEILEQVHIDAKDLVLVIGAGRLGQLIAQVLQTTGCQLEVIARHPRQKDLLSQRQIRALDEPSLAMHKYDFVVEATGSHAGFDLARHYVRPRGTIILKSTYKGNVDANLSSIVVDEITLIGSRCGPFDSALQLLESSRVDPGPLIDCIMPLEQGVQAFNDAALPGVLKILIKP